LLFYSFFYSSCMKYSLTVYLSFNIICTDQPTVIFSIFFSKRLSNFLLTIMRNFLLVLHFKPSPWKESYYFIILYILRGIYTVCLLIFTITWNFLSLFQIINYIIESLFLRQKTYFLFEYRHFSGSFLLSHFSGVCIIIDFLIFLQPKIFKFSEYKQLK